MGRVRRTVSHTQNLPQSLAIGMVADDCVWRPAPRPKPTATPVPTAAPTTAPEARADASSKIEPILATTVLNPGEQRVAFLLVGEKSIIKAPEASVSAVYVGDGEGAAQESAGRLSRLALWHPGGLQHAAGL